MSHYLYQRLYKSFLGRESVLPGLVSRIQRENDAFFHSSCHSSENDVKRFTIRRPSEPVWRGCEQPCSLGCPRWLVREASQHHTVVVMRCGHRTLSMCQHSIKNVNGLVGASRASVGKGLEKSSPGWRARGQVRTLQHPLEHGNRIRDKRVRLVVGTRVDRG